MNLHDLIMSRALSGSSGGSGASVQSDWNQNDETAPDYVKNRPFYDKSLVSVSHPEVPGLFWYKVSDAVPTGDYSEGAYCCMVDSGGKSNAQITLSTDDYYAASEFLIVVALKDNAVLEGITFPEKGTYFLAGEGLPIVTGFALGRDADPEITWDGSTGEIKTLGAKFLPDDHINSLIDAKLGVIENGSY